MNLDKAKPRIRPDMPLYDYSHANILGPSRNTSRKRINYTTIFLIAAAVFFAVSYIFFR